MNTYLKNLIEDFAKEESPKAPSTPQSAPKVFRLGRLNQSGSPEWGRTQDEDLVLLADEAQPNQDPLAEEAVPAEKKVGLTGTYSSRLFGSTTKYFASRIRKQ
jgi:hypothetical protein